MAWVQGQYCQARRLALKSSCLVLSTFQKLFGIEDLLLAHLHGVPRLCDVGFILFFLGMRCAVEGFDRLQQMLLKVREPLV